MSQIYGLPNSSVEVTSKTHGRFSGRASCTTSPRRQENRHSAAALQLLAETVHESTGVRLIVPVPRRHLYMQAVVLVAVGVVHVEVGWQWNVVVIGVVNCKLPVEVCCLEVAADEGLVVIELKVGAIPGHLHRAAVLDSMAS